MSNRQVTRNAVYVVVLNGTEEVLLQRRMNTGFLDGYWDLPSGHIEPGESILEAARRELDEEVCLQTSVEDLTLINITQNQLDIPYINFTLLAKRWHGEPKIGEPDKVSDVRFYARNALPENSTLGVRIIEKLGFPTELTFSFTDKHNFEEFMHEPFDPQTWGKK